MTNTINKIKEYVVSQFTRKNDKMGYACRNDRYRYILWMKNFTSVIKNTEKLTVAEEFYDYKSDREEGKNLAHLSEYKTIREQMKNK